ncbi:MAG: ATP-dependent zinc metalloprotease FtsH [Pirellulaceae bacterium]
MEKRPRDDGNQPNGPRPLFRGVNLWLLLAFIVAMGMAWLILNSDQRSTISYDFFKDQLEAKNVAKVAVGDEQAEGTFQSLSKANEDYWKKYPDKAKDEIKLQEKFRVVVPRGAQAQDTLQRLLDDANVPYEWKEPTSDNVVILAYAAMILLPIGLLIFMWISFRRTRNDIMGGGFLSGFSKSPARRYEGNKQPTTFKDVAGLEGVKADLTEIVDYLKNPEKFQKLGGRVPKGVLLNGPPGTGKTLLARAVAGEAGVPYYSVSGSEFIQMFVGVGASRVRDLFATAKETSPAIIFIDEIDAVGRQRGAGLGGGHDEREQTLNQILSEMDGFARNDSVIVLAATNRPDVLDPALLRPGRFDRHITVGRPTRKGRLEIFKVHVRDVPLAENVDLDTLAAGTAGLTGADIRNIVNEAALWAARQDKNKVEMSDFEFAQDKIQMGAKREEVLTEKEKERTAYHEAGHTLMAWLLPGTHPVHKVTIIPRGRALGVTQVRPDEDRFNMSEHELRDHLAMMLGGRSAEKMIFDDLTVGAENDLERATGLARRMVMHWGMSERLGPVSYKLSDEDPFLGREIHQQRQFSEHTMELIDDEVARILHEASERAKQVLMDNRGKLEKISLALIEQEEIDAMDIARLIGPSVHPPRAESNGKPKVEDKVQSDSPNGDESDASPTETESKAEADA